MTDKTPRRVKGFGLLFTLKINASSSMFQAIPRLLCSGKSSCTMLSPTRSLPRSSDWDEKHGRRAGNRCVKVLRFMVVKEGDYVLCISQLLLYQDLKYFSHLYLTKKRKKNFAKRSLRDVRQK
jgi:hypothetical protein